MKTNELRKLMKTPEFKANFRERLLANNLFDLADAGYRNSQERTAMRYIAGVMRSYFQTLQRLPRLRTSREPVQYKHETET